MPRTYEQGPAPDARTASELASGEFGRTPEHLPSGGTAPLVYVLRANQICVFDSAVSGVLSNDP